MTNSWDNKWIGVVALGKSTTLTTSPIPSKNLVDASVVVEAIGSSNKECSDLGGFANLIGISAGSGKYRYGIINEASYETATPIDSNASPATGIALGASADSDIAEITIYDYVAYAKVDENLSNVNPLAVMDEAIEKFPDTHINGVSVNDFRDARDKFKQKQSSNQESIDKASEESLNYYNKYGDGVD